MKYTEQLLIGISFLATLLVGSGCTNEEVIGGDGSNAAHPVVQTIRATKSDFNNTKQTDVPLTRTETDGYKTTFKAGDKIGLFAIKNNVIVDDVNNMKLTYTVAEDGTTRWSLPTDSKIYYYEGVTYIAYSPYKERITINPSQSTSSIVSSLVDNENLQPTTDQSDATKYAASDLMIATASANAENIDKVTLTLNFEHQFSLLLMTPQVLYSNITEPTYTDGKTAGFTYRSSAKSYEVDPNANNITLSGITPLEIDGSYRAIMKSEALKSLSVQYTTENQKLIYYNGNISISSGQYYVLAVNSPVEHDTELARPLRPGDFVFYGESGIEIYPGNGPLDATGRIPDYTNAVGIVVTCDPERLTDEECKKKGWNHAYVIGFVTDPSPHTWGSINDEDLGNYTTENLSTNMNGYSETTYLETVDAVIITYTLAVIRNNKIPDNLVSVRSDWFIPSIGQYYDLLANLCGKSPASFTGGKTESSWIETIEARAMYSRLQSHYAKLGRSLLLNGSFWSSSEYDAGNAWYLLISSSQIGLQIKSKAVYQNPDMRVYAFFAF